MTTVATCSMCHETKRMDEFYRDRAKRSGLTSRCKDCTKSASMVSYRRRRPSVLHPEGRGTEGMCKTCGASFTRDSARHVYCSSECFRQMNNSKRRISARGVSCRSCGAEPYSEFAFYCQPCSDQVKRDRMREASRQKAAQYGTSYRRRARRFRVDYEPINRETIFDRDGWRCHLCGAKVDKRLKWPHPQSVSLDHIVPMSLGGSHTRENVATSHLECNVQKGDHQAGDQLALIG